jgi:hypothetical protein
MRAFYPTPFLLWFATATAIWIVENPETATSKSRLAEEFLR